MITFNIVTLFPELFEPFLNTLPLKRGIEKGVLKVNLIQLRDFAVDKRGTVDGKSYGGGVGMLLRIEPVWKAIEYIYGTSVEEAQKNKENSIAALSPSGKKFTQKTAIRLTKKSSVTLICGRYEGMDARITDHLATDVISMGDFVLSGGELPALAIMESVVRLLPGILEKEEATNLDSFMPKIGGKKEYPQYTRPEKYRGLKVPEVLLSGDHGKVARWRKNERQEPH